jgi:oligo-alginate lyase
MGHNWWSHIVFGAGVAALAVLDEEPRAKAWVSRLDEASQEWANYSGSAIETKPATFGSGGAFTESINYADFGGDGLLRFRRAWSEALKEPLAPLPVLDRFGEYFVANSYPSADGTLSVNFGDGSPRSSGAHALVNLWALGDRNPHYLRYLDGVRALPKQDVFAEPQHMILWPSASERAAAVKAADPALSWIDRDLGTATLRSSWKPDASLLAIRSGFTWNHNHADAGSFIFWSQGKPLLIDSGNSSYSRSEYDGYYRQSVAHNVVTLDGEAEPASNTYDGSHLFGRVDHLVDDGDLRFVWADATGPNARTFARKFRSWLWIGETILVIDDLKGWKAGQFEWLMHYAGEAKRVGQVIGIKNGAAELAVQPLFPETLPDGGLPTDYPEKLRLAEGVGLEDHAPDTKTPYLRLQAPSLTDRAKFVVALQPGKPGSGARLERFETKDYLGVRLRKDGQVTEVYLNLLADGRIRHRNANAKLGPWETDAYLLAVTYPEGGSPAQPTRWFVADGSYLRRDGDLRLDSLSKVFVSVRSGGDRAHATLEAQPIHAVRLGCGGARAMTVDGQSFNCPAGVAVARTTVRR